MVRLILGLMILSSIFLPDISSGQAWLCEDCYKTTWPGGNLVYMCLLADPDPGWRECNVIDPNAPCWVFLKCSDRDSNPIPVDLDAPDRLQSSPVAEDQLAQKEPANTVRRDVVEAESVCYAAEPGEAVFTANLVYSF